jgi:hypothetical protein
VRQALNKNPIAQAALIGVLAIGVAFMLLTRVAGGDEPAATAPAPTTASAAPSADPAATAPTADAAGAPTAPAGGAQAPPSASGSPDPSATPPTDFVAGPGLPEPVVKAYEDGRPVVVLITRKAGVEDKRLRAMVDSARSIGDSAVFTTNAHGIARYSRITRGVDVSRVPALVVLRPRRLNDGPVPAATVSYGFRGPESVEQAVRDALYEGRRNLPYYPE